MKKCTVCKEGKTLDCYYKSKISKDGYGYRCKSCDRTVRATSRSRSKETKKGYSRRALMSMYGLTIQDYENMLKAQNRCCAICGTDNPLGEGNHSKRSYFSFCVDHCHTTGKVRGLLCNPCNRGLGFFKDSVEFLLKAGEYLIEGM